MDTPPEIVYLSRVLWDGLYQRPQHLAVGLARRFPVLFVDTPRSTFFRRFVRPLAVRRPVRPLLWSPAPGLTVLCPPYVPFLPGVWPPPFQYGLHSLFIRWAARRLGMAQPIVSMQDPRDDYVLSALRPRLTCYDCIDDYAQIAPSPRARPILQAKEADLLKRANLVFASSTELARRCAMSNRHVVLVPNGVDADHFSPAHTPPSAPDLAAIPGPRLGYAGSLAPWVDLDLLMAVAHMRPDWSLVLVGPADGRIAPPLAALAALPNVHVLGERPYAAMPSYIQGFDVCLIPFRINALTQAVNPLKFFEYMAMGKPVVATRLPELAAFANVCGLADSPAGFAVEIEKALATTGDARLVEQRLAVARANTWEQRVATISEALLGAISIS